MGVFSYFVMNENGHKKLKKVVRGVLFLFITFVLSLTNRFAFPDSSCGQNDIPHDEFDNVVFSGARSENVKDDARFPHMSPETLKENEEV